jgi:hypothetical protein
MGWFILLAILVFGLWLNLTARNDSSYHHDPRQSNDDDFDSDDDDGLE